MYSWEIDNYIVDRRSFLNRNEYFYITNLDRNPQISQVSYNAFSDDYTIRTKDGYCWVIHIRS